MKRSERPKIVLPKKKVKLEEKSQVERLEKQAKNLTKKSKGRLAQTDVGGIPWPEKHRPTSLQSHFVNPRKVEEVKNWMSKAMKSEGSKLAIIRGPSGSGKTATVHLVARDLGLEVVEWSTPNEQIGGAFEEFVLKGSTYNPLPLKGVKKHSGRILVVEDLPHFPGKSEMIGGILRGYSAEAGYPLVFLLPEEGEEGRAFGKRTLALHSIPEFGFRPVAPTFMARFLKAVCSAERLGDAGLDEIVEMSDGDLRFALNSLQMKSEGRGIIRRTQRGKKVAVKSGREESVYLFRSLGKILYAKRAGGGLVEDPLALQDRIRTPPATLLSFLHGNYERFFVRVEEAAAAAGLLATADLFLSKWQSGEEIGQRVRIREDLALTCSVLGMMSTNTNPISRGFQPFKKPLDFDCRTTQAEMRGQMKLLREEKNPNVEDSTPQFIPEHLFFTELAPFLGKISNNPTYKRMGIYLDRKRTEDFKEGDFVSEEEETK